MRKANVNEAEEARTFVEVVGFENAERLMMLYGRSFPTGTEYDKLFRNGQYHTKDQNFARLAMSEGFTRRDVNLFLRIQQ
jgi:hypothetical protein